LLPCRIIKGTPRLLQEHSERGKLAPVKGRIRNGHHGCSAPRSLWAKGAEARRQNMSIQVATVNGSGSQSSNTVLLRSIFQMGVPVSGKNLFPSNIAGLPTW